jgi:prepilin-type processing-associated H-X9-DG protein
MEKLKFITFTDMFNHFTASNFIWEYFLAFLTDLKLASNYAFFDSHVECFPTKTSFSLKMPIDDSAFCKQKRAEIFNSGCYGLLKKLIVVVP